MATKKPRPKHPPRRNAAPPRPPAPRPARSTEPPETPVQHLLYTAGGALGASLVGALAARYGLQPSMVATLITASGGALAWKAGTQRTRTIAAGAASAGGSQLMLLKLKMPDAAPKPQTVAANQNQQPPVRPKNADIGALPHGALDAAFERARAELAISAHGEHAHDGLEFAA